MYKATVLSIIVLFCACTHKWAPPKRSDFISRKIQELEKAPVRNPPGKIIEYRYNNQVVYFIPSYCCDQFSELYDEKGNIICHPDGGITGKGDGICKDFSEMKMEEKVLWEDKR